MYFQLALRFILYKAKIIWKKNQMNIKNTYSTLKKHADKLHFNFPKQLIFCHLVVFGEVGKQEQITYKQKERKLKDLWYLF